MNGVGCNLVIDPPRFRTRHDDQ